VKKLGHGRILYSKLDCCMYYCASNYYVAGTRTNLYIYGERISISGSCFLVKKFSTYILNRKLWALEAIH
jgi:hypothetical protein